MGDYLWIIPTAVNASLICIFLLWFKKEKGGENEKMSDVLVFKVQSLTEGGYVTFAPEYSQYSESLDLAAKRLQVQVDAQVKTLQAELRKQNSPAAGGPPKP